MNQDLFEIRPLAETSFFQRLLKQYPHQNAVIELNNLLASKPLLDVSEQDVTEIERRYRLILSRAFKLNMEEFYAVYFNHCLQHNGPSAEETKKLRHLAGILHLGDKTISQLRIKIGEQFYERAIRKAVSKGSLTEPDKVSLANYEAELQLPGEMVRKITASGDLSPAREDEILNVARGLDIDLKNALPEAAQERLRRLKVYWSLGNAEPSVIEADIHLRSQELCYLTITGVKRFELKNSSKSPDYSGHFTVLQAAKLFYVGGNQMKLQSNDSSVMKLMDTGTLYLTNQRVFFTGKEKTTTITFEKITDIKPYSDGVEILKNAGKHHVFQLREMADVFCIQLERQLKERNS